MSRKTKATATKEKAKPTLVPKLRFPEFRGGDGWEQTTLGAVARLKNGYAFKSADYVDSGPFQIITIANVQQGAIALEVAKRIAQPPADIQTHQKLRIGDILISMTGNVGRVCRVTCDSLLLNQRVGKLMPEEIDPEFFYHSLQRDEFRNAMQLKAAGGAQGNLSGGDITDYPLHRPADAAEQQKIAECLSSVDELMTAQARKLDALKTHKKGLMQQLFPREGETQPHLRFPEFQNAGEWSEGRLADIATVLQGYGFPERHQGQKSGDYPFYKVSDISRSLAAGKVFIEESSNYVNEGLLKELRAKPIPEGTTVFAKIGEAIRSNRRAITTVPCLIDNNAAGVKRIKGKATDMFIYLLMEQISLIDHAGGVVPAVNKSAIEEIAIKFPTPAEQQRIASCLSSLDALIAAETQKHDALKTHKKGLMQRLFPSPEEEEA